MESEEKKANRKSASHPRPRSESLSRKGGVRGTYALRYRAGPKLVLLDPELSALFPTDDAVNDALRALLRMTESARWPHRGPGQTGGQARRASSSS